MTPRTSIVAIALVTLRRRGSLVTVPAASFTPRVYALAAAIGLPLGFKLFGRHQPAGWVAGALIGYVLTAFGLWAAIAAGVPSRCGSWFHGWRLERRPGRLDGDAESRSSRCPHGTPMPARRSSSCSC